MSLSPTCERCLACCCHHHDRYPLFRSLTRWQVRNITLGTGRSAQGMQIISSTHTHTHATSATLLSAMVCELTRTHMSSRIYWSRRRASRNPLRWTPLRTFTSAKSSPCFRSYATHTPHTHTHIHTHNHTHIQHTHSHSYSHTYAQNTTMAIILMIFVKVGHVRW